MKEKDLWNLAIALLGSLGVILGALGGTIGFFLTRLWNKRDREADKRARERELREDKRERELALKEAYRARQRDILYESLKWFEGKTQKRSIGIAVVCASWNAHEEFRALWTEVFANQAIYLLMDSHQGDHAHERDNLRRIMEVLVREASLLDKNTRGFLSKAIEEKLNPETQGGLTLTPELTDLLKKWNGQSVRS
jgi:hypothetical protein